MSNNPLHCFGEGCPEKSRCTPGVDQTKKREHGATLTTTSVGIKNKLLAPGALACSGLGFLSEANKNLYHYVPIYKERLNLILIYKRYLYFGTEWYFFPVLFYLVLVYLRAKKSKNAVSIIPPPRCVPACQHGLSRAPMTERDSAFWSDYFCLTDINHCIVRIPFQFGIFFLFLAGHVIALTRTWYIFFQKSVLG